MSFTSLLHISFPFLIRSKLRIRLEKPSFSDNWSEQSLLATEITETVRRIGTCGLGEKSVY